MTGPTEGDVIAVWFSCGAASAMATKLTLQRYGNLCDVRVVNNPVMEEDEDNRRFLADVQSWIGVSIEDVRNVKYPNASAEEVWDRRGGMSFPHGAPCTQHLKKEARQQWEAINKPDWHVFGFGAEERDRHNMFTLTERANVLPILIDAGLTRQDCYEMVVNAGLRPPAFTSLAIRTQTASAASRRPHRPIGTTSERFTRRYSCAALSSRAALAPSSFG